MALPKGEEDPEKSACMNLYKIFSVWGEISDISIRNGIPFIQYAHRFYAEFAREAMGDQMEIFDG